MKQLISFITICSLLLPVPLFAKEVPKIKSAVQIQKKPTAKSTPTKQVISKKTVVPTKKKQLTTPSSSPKQVPKSRPKNATELQPQTTERKAEPSSEDTKSKAKELLKKNRSDKTY